MDHRTALATFRTLALRTGTRAGRAARVAADRVVTRVAERRSSRRSTPPGGREPDVPVRRMPETADQPARRAVASPVDVARAVARNAAGLPRTNPALQRTRVRRSVPGAKLPARAGQGVLGV